MTRMWRVLTVKGNRIEALGEAMSKAQAEQTMTLFLGHVLRTHPGAQVTTDNGWTVRYASGDTRRIYLEVD